MNRFSRPAVDENEKPIDILDLKLSNFKKIYLIFLNYINGIIPIDFIYWFTNFSKKTSSL